MSIVGVIALAVVCALAVGMVVAMGVAGGFKGTVGILCDPARVARARASYMALGETPEARRSELGRLLDEEHARRAAERANHWMRKARRGGPP